MKDKNWSLVLAHFKNFISSRKYISVFVFEADLLKFTNFDLVFQVK